MTENDNIELKQAQFLKDLEKSNRTHIPIVKKIDWNTSGVKIEGRNVIELVLRNRFIKTLPESIGDLYSLKALTLFNIKLTTLPESIGNLKSLEELDLTLNKLTTLPESIGNLKSLEKLFLDTNKLSTLPESIGNLKSLEKLFLNRNKLTTLPESIGNLKSLEKLILKYNKLTTLPESIGNLKSLKEIELQNNKLTTLPESIGNLKSLEELSLSGNKLTTLPESFWRLKNLESLWLSHNPWEEAWNGISNYSIHTVLERSRHKAPIIVFISHSKGDKNQYRVNNLKKKLKGQKEISEVLGNGENDISESHLVLFIATKNSMSDEQCQHELKLARTHNIGIIPIKGIDITFEDLSHIDLGEDYKMKDKLGFEFEGKKFEQFCGELYEYIKKYKREVNVFESDLNGSFDPEQRKTEKQWEDVKTLFKKFVESDEFRENIEENFEDFKKLSRELRTEHITPVEYIIKWSRILKSKLN